MATNLYGTQAPPMPGQANVGYGPGGGIFDMSNPVYQTQGGLRPGNAAGVGGNAPATGPYAQPAWQNAPRRPYAWTGPGKELAAREQQMYGQNFYGNPAATPGSGSGGTGSGGAGAGGTGVTTGISATLPPGVTDAARIAMLRSAGVPLSGAQSGDLIGHYGDLTRSLLSADNVDLARLGAFKQHGLQSGMEQARANAGIGWGNIGAGYDALQTQDLLGQLGLFGDRLRLAGGLFN